MIRFRLPCCLPPAACRLLFLLLAACLLIVAPSRADEFKTLAGKTIRPARSPKISDSEIVLKTATGAASTPLAQVLDLTLRPGHTLPKAEKYLEVQLLDESLLRCSKVTYAGKDAVMELTSGGAVKVPLAALVSILRDAQDADLKKQWDKLLRARIRTDRIFVLRSGDLNPIPGALGEIDPAKQTIKFKPEGAAEIEPALEKLQGLHFARTDSATEQSLCKVIDIDGNTLVASKLAFGGAKLEVTTAFGTKASLDPKVVSRFDFNFGRLTYLSDLDAKMAESFLLGGFNPTRRDKNLDGLEIMLGGKQYAKGLSMYAGADLEYGLAGKYREFKAIMGADARIAEEGQGKVLVTIYCDREKRFSELVSTKNLRNIAINVKDVNTLRIVVSGSNFTNYSGHATLANAYVSQ